MQVRLKQIHYHFLGMYDKFSITPWAGITNSLSLLGQVYQILYHLQGKWINESLLGQVYPIFYHLLGRWINSLFSISWSGVQSLQLGNYVCVDCFCVGFFLSFFLVACGVSSSDHILWVFAWRLTYRKKWCLQYSACDRECLPMNQLLSEWTRQCLSRLRVYTHVQRMMCTLKIPYPSVIKE